MAMNFETWDIISFISTNSKKLVKLIIIILKCQLNILFIFKWIIKFKIIEL